MWRLSVVRCIHRQCEGEDLEQEATSIDGSTCPDFVSELLEEEAEDGEEEDEVLPLRGEEDVVAVPTVGVASIDAISNHEPAWVCEVQTGHFIIFPLFCFSLLPISSLDFFVAWNWNGSSALGR